MDACEAKARQDVSRLLNDAAGERRNGLDTTDVGMLTEHLVEALARIGELEGESSAEEDRHDNEVSDLKAAAACNLTDDQRKAHKSCEECAACRLSEAKREIDCGATDEQRSVGACQSADDLGIDRCGKCAAQRAEQRVEDECADRDNEIARLTRERDAMVTPTAREEAKRETLLREIESLNNRLQIVTQERNDAVIRAGVIRAPKPDRAPKVAEGPSLFDRLEHVATAQVKAKRKVKRYPLGVKP